VSTFDSGGTFDSGFGWDAAADPYSATTLRLYNRLPAIYRDADATAGEPPNDFPLLRWIASIVDQAGDLETLVDRIAPPASSALTDPSTADAGWLPWLAQLVGARVTAGTPVDQQRAAILSAVGGWQAGTRSSIVAAARTQLTGSRFVQLVDHVGGDMWQMQIITRPSESPTPDTVLTAISHAGCKPAGVTFTHLYYEASWSTIETVLGSWAGWAAAGTSDPLLTPGSWGAIEETQPGGTAGTWSAVETVYPSWSSWATAGSWSAIEAA
jgi:hypothetical protein